MIHCSSRSSRTNSRHRLSREKNSSWRELLLALVAVWLGTRTIGMIKPCNHKSSRMWQQLLLRMTKVDGLLRRNSILILPVADAWARSPPSTAASRRSHGGRGTTTAWSRTDSTKPSFDVGRRFVCRSWPSSTPSSTLLAAVPELDDDSFRDDSNNHERISLPSIGDGYLEGGIDQDTNNFGFDQELPPDGYQDFTLDHARREPMENTKVENPFPFPEPSFSYTEDGNSLEGSSSSYFASASNDERKATPTAPFRVPGTSSTPPSHDNDATNTTSGATAQIGSTTSNQETIGKRSMTTMANSTTDTISSQQDAVDRIDAQADPAPVDPFQTTTDDTASGPIKPLVAPLKLSTSSSSSSSAVETTIAPSIQTNNLDDIVDSLTGQLQSIQNEIETMAPSSMATAKTINLNSPKQVSLLLFGQPDMSTNKATLEGMAGSNILAKLVLEYRDTKRKLKRTLKQQENRNSNVVSKNDREPKPVRPMKDPLVLVDTSSFIFRAYYSHPPIHRATDGMPVGAVMGFCSMLNNLLLTSLLKGETPLLVQCLDAPGKSFRNDLYEDYKAHRAPTPLDLVPQFDLINAAAKAYGMIQIQATGFEADDVIATLATKASQSMGQDVKILSGDKDLMQLITNNENDDDDESTGRVHMIRPMTDQLITHDVVWEIWGVEASQLGDLLALAGDSADNVPGVPGIGPKIAAQLLQEFGTLEQLLQNTHDIPQPKRREKLETNAELALISRELVELERGLQWSQMQAYYPPDDEGGDGGDENDEPTLLLDSITIEDLRMQPINVDRILAFYDSMGFKRLKNQLMDQAAKIKPDIRSTEISGTEHEPQVPMSRPSSAAAPSFAAVEATLEASSQTRTEPQKKKPQQKKPSSKRNFWEKKIRGVPKPEDFKDVPF